MCFGQGARNDSGVRFGLIANLLLPVSPVSSPNRKQARSIQPKYKRRHMVTQNAEASFLPLLDYQERKSHQARRGTHGDPNKNYQGI